MWDTVTKTYNLVAVILCFMASNVFAHSNVESAVNHSQRSDSSRQKDAGRKPIQLFTFAEVLPGGIIFELGAGGGHSTELAALIVAEQGHVYAHNLSSSEISAMDNVTALRSGLIYQVRDRAHEAGLNDGGADVVLMFFTFHALYLNSNIDIQMLLENIKHLLKPSGKLIIADNAAEKGSGLRDTLPLHRIDEELVKNDILKVGFIFETSSDLLRNSEDDVHKHWRYLKKPRQHDRFLMKFRKPAMD